MESYQDQGQHYEGAMDIIQGDSTLNGLQINFKKCQLLSKHSKQDLSMFHLEILCCSTPNFEILGATIGSPDLCTTFIEKKRNEANQLQSLLPKLCDHQSAIALLRVCASFCWLAHQACSISPTAASLEAFARFGEDVLHCLECSLDFELLPQAYNQAQLGLTYGGARIALPDHPCTSSLHRFLVYLINTNPSIKSNYAAPL